MDISVRKQANVQVVRLRGDLKIGDAVDAFRTTIEEHLAAGDSSMVINLGEVRIIDSSGIGVLVRSLASAKQRGGSIKLVNPSKFAVQTMKIVGVLNLFQVYDDEAAAVASFQ